MGRLAYKSSTKFSSAQMQARNSFFSAAKLGPTTNHPLDKSNGCSGNEIGLLPEPETRSKGYLESLVLGMG